MSVAMVALKAWHWVSGQSGSCAVSPSPAPRLTQALVLLPSGSDNRPGAEAREEFLLCWSHSGYIRPNHLLFFVGRWSVWVVSSRYWPNLIEGQWTCVLLDYWPCLEVRYWPTLVMGSGVARVPLGTVHRRPGTRMWSCRFCPTPGKSASTGTWTRTHDGYHSHSPFLHQIGM